MEAMLKIVTSFFICLSISAFAEVTLMKEGARCSQSKEGHQVKRIRYKKEKVKFNENCESEVQKITCTNGRFTKWTGSFNFKTCTFAANVEASTSDEKSILESFKKKSGHSKGDDYIPSEDNHEESENIEKILLDEDGERDPDAANSASLNMDKELSNKNISRPSSHPLDSDQKIEKKDTNDTMDANDLDDI